MGPKRRSKFYHPVRTPLLLCMTGGLSACLLLALLYRRTGLGWVLSAAITCGVSAYLISLRFLAPALLFLFFRRRYNVRARWFQPKPWEAKLYRRLNVKKWKKDMVTYEPGEFSLELHSLEEISANMCHAELVHELSALLSFTVLACTVRFGSFPVFLAAAILSAAIECPFIIIQRYNRPRLVRLAEKKNYPPAKKS